MIDSGDAYNWNDPIYGGKKTDNDLAALRALNSAENSEPGSAEGSGPDGVENSGPDNGIGDDFDIPDLRQKNRGGPGPEAGSPDAGFERGEYWLRYFREGSPEDEPIWEDEPEPQEEEPKAEPSGISRMKEGFKKAAARFGAFGARKGGEAVKEARPAESQQTLAARKPPVKNGKRALVAAAVVLGALVTALVVVAEPWTPAEADEYFPPQPVSLGGTVDMAVGEVYSLDVPLGENERISSVVSPDDDILSVIDYNVTAMGEWESAKVVITTMEAELPPSEPKPLKILGIDLTAPYNSLRTGLRELFGIEKRDAAPRELRVLGIYEQEFRVKGYDVITAPMAINLYTNDYCDLTVNVPDGREVEFQYEGGVVSVEKTLPSPEGFVTYTARSSESTGTGKIIAKMGFFKDGKFVTTSAVEFNVEIVAQPDPGEEAVFTSGGYNGSVVVEPEEEQEAPEDQAEDQAA
jgi:hypothetical protein